MSFAIKNSVSSFLSLVRHLVESELFIAVNSDKYTYRGAVEVCLVGS